MTDSKSVAFGRGGSSPPTGTTFDNPSRMAGVFLCLKSVVCGLERHAGYTQHTRDADMLIHMQPTVPISFMF